MAQQSDDQSGRDLIAKLVKSATREPAFKIPKWMRLDYVAKGYRGNETTYVMKGTLEYSYFDAGHVLVQDVGSVKDVSISTLEFVNPRYAAEFDQAPEGVYMLKGLNKTVEPRQLDILARLSEWVLAFPMIDSQWTVSELLTNSDFEHAIARSGDGSWELTIQAKGGTAPEDWPLKAVLLISSAAEPKVSSISVHYPDRSVLTTYEYGGDHSLFDGHRTREVRRTMNQKGELRREQVNTVVDGRTSNLPASKAACYLPHYGLPEPPEFREADRRWLYWIAGLAMFSVVCLLVARKLQSR